MRVHPPVAGILPHHDAASGLGVAAPARAVIGVPPAQAQADEGGRSPAPVPPLDLSAEGRRERHRKETFDRLVRAARTIMFNRGLNDVTVQEITDAADVGKGTFFNYFQSKGHVFSRVAEFNRRGLVRTVERVRDGERSSEEALIDLLVWLMCPPTGEWLTYESNAVRALVTQPDVRRSFSEQLRAGLPHFEELMALGQQRGAIRDDLSSPVLAEMAHYFVAGSQILHWIHSLAPTPDAMASQVRQFFTLLGPPTGSAVPPPTRAAARKSRRKPRAAGKRAIATARRDRRPRSAAASTTAASKRRRS